MGKAVKIMLGSGRKSGPVNENGGPTSNGKGGIPASLKVKAAGIKPASVTNAGLSSPKLPQGEKINNLF